MFKSNDSNKAKESKLRQALANQRLSALKQHVLEKAMTSSDPSLHYQAGLLCASPESPDYDKATLWLTQAVKGGNPHAKLLLAQLQIASGEPELISLSHDLLVQAAAEGLTEAESDLGVMFEFGIGVERDLKQAFKWYQNAASGGVAQAQYNLALMYLDVDYPIHDIILGVYWLRVAANQHHSKAQMTLAQMYERGDNVAQDVLKSEKLYVTAAQNADSHTQMQMALRYCRGNGVPLDRRKAVRWLEKAANNQDGGSMSDLAMLCLLEKRKTGKLPPMASSSKPSQKVRRSHNQLANRSEYYV